MKKSERNFEIWYLLIFFWFAIRPATSQIVGDFDFYTFNNSTIRACDAPGAPQPGTQGIAVFNILNIGVHRPARVIGLNAHGKPIVLRFAAETTGCSPQNNLHTMGYAIHAVAGATGGNWPMTIEGLIPGSTVSIQMSTPAFGIMGGTPATTREFGVNFGGATTVIPSTNGGILVPVGTEIASGSTVTAQIIANPSGGDAEFNIDRVQVTITEPSPVAAAPFDFIGRYNFVSDGTGPCAQRGETEGGFTDVVVSGSVAEMPQINLGPNPCPSACDCTGISPCTMTAALCGPVTAFGGCDLPNDIAHVEFCDSIDFKLTNLPPGTMAELFFAGGGSGTVADNDIDVTYGGMTTMVLGPGVLSVGTETVGGDGEVTATITAPNTANGANKGHISQFVVCLKFPDTCPPTAIDLGCFNSEAAALAAAPALPTDLMGTITTDEGTNAVPVDDCLILWEREICSDVVITPTFVRSTAFPDTGNVGLDPNIINPAQSANGIINNLNGAGPDGFQYNTVAVPMPSFTYSFTVPSGYIVDCFEVYGTVFTAINEQITSYDIQITDNSGMLVYSGSASTPTLLANGVPLDICALNLGAGSYTIELTDTDPPNSCKELSEVQFTAKSVTMQRAKFVIGGPLLASVTDRDLGCIYGISSIPPFSPLQVTASSDCSDTINITTCGDFIDAATSMPFTVLNDCSGVVYRCYQVADNCGNSTQLVQRLDYRFDREPPKLVAPQGRSLGCLPPGSNVAEFVELLAPVCVDLSNVVVTESCTDCTFTVCCETAPEQFTVGNDVATSGSADGWTHNMVVDEDSLYTNMTGEPQTLLIPKWNFYAQPNAMNPVTPFVVTVQGDNLFTVVAIGDTVTSAGYTAGALNCVPFSAAPAMITLMPGETIAMGFTDSDASGNGGGMASTIPFVGGGQIWYSGHPSADAAQLVLGSAPIDGTTTLLTLNRDYRFEIQFEVACGGNGTVSLWCDTYTTNDCAIVLERKIRAIDCCGNVSIVNIIYTLNDRAPVITGTEMGRYLGCTDTVPAPDLTAFTFDCPGAPVFIPECATSVSDVAVTNDISCEVRVSRTFRVESCCGLFDERTVDYTYTQIPDLQAGPLADLSLGCIASTNQIPLVDLTMFAASSSCQVVSIRKIATSMPVVQDDDCTVSFRRTFEVETLCGVMQLVNQEVSYILNNEQPELVSVPKGTDHGCQDANFMPPLDIDELEVVGITTVDVSCIELPLTGEVCRLSIEDNCLKIPAIDLTKRTDIYQISGGDIGEGWDLSYGIVTEAANFFGAATTLQCVDFSNDAATGVINNAPRVIDCNGNGPNIFGTTPDDLALANLSSPIIWALGSEAPFNITFPTTPGVFYQADLLLWSGNCGDRFVDVVFGNDFVGDNVLAGDGDDDPSVVSVTFCATNTTHTFTINTPGAGPDPNPVVSGLLVRDLSGSMGSYTAKITKPDTAPTWDKLVIDELVPPGSSITYEIANAGGTVLIPATPSMAGTIDLSGIPASETTLCLTIEMTQTDPSASPTICGLEAKTNLPVPLAPSDMLSITNWSMTNGCDVTYTRVFRVEDCCGNFDRREVTHTYTLAPDPVVVSALAPIELGCIASTNQIPPPSDLLIGASSACSVVSIEWAGDTVGGLDICPAIQEAESLRLNGAFVTATGNSIPSGGTPSGGTYIVAPNGSGFATGVSGNFAEGDFLVFTPGTYQVTVYVRTPNFGAGNAAGNNDSFHFSIDGGAIVTDNGQNFQNTFGPSVVPGGPYALDAGPHTFQIYMREDGAEIDRIEFSLVAAADPEACDPPEILARAYQIEDLCGNISTITQCITYSVDTAPPRIDAVMAFQDYGCVAEDPRPRMDSTNALVTSDIDGNIVATNLVMETSIPLGDGCGILVTRTWRVDDCCGGFDLKDEVYQYTLAPTGLSFTAIAPTPIDIGCLTSSNQVPPAVPSLYQASAPAFLCAPSMLLLEAEDTTVRSGVNNAANHVGFTGTGFADYGGGGTFVEFNVPGGPVGGAATATFRYAVGSAGPRSADVIVNGASQGTAVFALTGAWTAWVTESVPVMLNPGPNTIRVQSFGAGPNLDSLLMELPCGDPVEFDCPVEISWMGDRVVSNNLQTCQTFLERVYMATNECGLTAFTTQEIVYAADRLPEITMVPDGMMFGCQATAPALPDAFENFAATNAASTNVTTITNTTDCLVTITRVYEVVACCGSTDEVTVEFTYVPTPAPPMINGPSQINLGCITSGGLVPVPDPGLFTVDAICGATLVPLLESNSLPTDECSFEITRVYRATDNCNQITDFTQTISYSLAVQPEITGVEADAYLGCQDRGFMPPTNLSNFVVSAAAGTTNFNLACENLAFDFVGATSNVSVYTNGSMYAYTGDGAIGLTVPALECPACPGAGETCITTSTNPTTTLTGDLYTSPGGMVTGNPALNINGGSFVSNCGMMQLSNLNFTQPLPPSGQFINRGIVDVVFNIRSLNSFTPVNYLQLSGATYTRSLAANFNGGPLNIDIQGGEFFANDFLGGGATLRVDLTIPDQIELTNGKLYLRTNEVSRTLLDDLLAMNVISGADANNITTVTTNIPNTAVNGDYWVICAADPIGPACLPSGGYSTIITAICGQNDFLGWETLNPNVFAPPGTRVLVTVSNMANSVSYGSSTNGASIDLSGVTDPMLNVHVELSTTQTNDCLSPLLEGFCAAYACDLPATNAANLTLTEHLTTNGCEITMRRTYRYEGCCEQFDEHDVFLRWTERPAFFLDPIPALDEGCIASTNLISEPNITILSYTAECGLVRMDFVGTTNVMIGSLADCSNRLQRIYEIEDVCGAVTQATQTVTWTLETPPAILSAEVGQDWGCQDPGFSPPGMFTGTNYITNTVSEATTVTNCSAIVRRVYRVEDCCGNFDRWEVQHTYTVRPTPASVAELAPLNVGCIGSTGLVPVASAVIVQIQTAACNIASITWMGDSAPTNLGDCVEQITRVYTVTDPCGQTTTVTQEITYSVDTGNPVIASVAAFADYGCQVQNPRPADTNSVMFTDDNADSVTLTWWETVIQDGCDITVTRTWRAEDCCGNFDLKDEVYRYSLTPVPEIIAPLDEDLGCLNTPNQVPPAVPGAVEALAMVPPADLMGASVFVTNLVTSTTNDIGPIGGAFTNAITVLGSAVVSTNVEYSFLHDLDIDATGMTVTYTQPVNLTNITDTLLVTISNPGTLLAGATLSTNAPANVALLQLDATSFQLTIPQPVTGTTFRIDFALVPANPQSCPVTVMHDGDTVSSNGCAYSVARVYTATDHCGVTISATQTLTFVVDNEEPKFVNNPGGNLGCVSGPPPATDDLLFFNDGTNATDNCGVVVTLMGGVPSTNGCLNTMTRTYMALDDCGNSVLEEVVYTWYDIPSAGPVVSSTTIDAGCISSLAQLPSPNPLTVSTAVECVLMELRHQGDAQLGPLPGQACVQELHRLWLASDLCGAATLHTQVITYVIRELPEVTVAPAILELGCQTGEPSPPFTVTSTLGTNATPAQIVGTSYSTNGCEITATRTWRVENCCGEFDEASAIYRWTATPGIPQLIGPARLNLGCINTTGAIPVAATSQFTPVGGCDASVELLEEGPHFRASNCTSLFIRIYQITDECGQTNQFVQTITYLVEDPVAILATEAGGNFGCTVPVIPPAISNVVLSGDNAIGVFATDTLTSNGCVRTLTREYLAEDCCGNFDEATVVWTWIESGASPAIEGPATLDLGCIAEFGQVPQPSTSQFVLDASCGGSIAFTGESDGPTDDCQNSLIRVYTATDVCGQAAGFTQTISWVLTSEPEILFTEIGTNYGCAGNLAPPADVNAIGATGNLVSREVSEVLTTNGCTITLTRTYRVEDCCGAFDEASVVYTWQDASGAPDISGPERIDLGCIADAGQVPQPNTGLFTSSADCGATIAFMGQGAVQSDGCTNILLRTYRATATCGQVSDLVQTITWVISGDAPEILSTEPNQTFGCSDVIPAPAADPSSLVTTGSVESIDVSEVLATNGCEITLTRTYTVTDCCGNRDRADVIFRWHLLPALPVVDGPSELNMGCIPGTGVIPVPATSQFTVNSLCGAELVFSQETTPVANGCLFSFVRTYTATDNCGQSIDFDQVVTYSLGAVAPEITAVQAGDHFGCVATNLDGTPVSPVPPVDFAALQVVGDVITQSVSEVTTTNGCDRKLVRTYRVQDCCGAFDNMSTEFTWSEDNTPPVIIPPDDFVADRSLGCNPGVVNLPPISPGTFTAVDDCGLVQVLHGGDSIATNGCAGTLTRLYIASDDCGNASTVTQTIRFVTDTAAPQPSIVPPDMDLGCAPVDIPDPEDSVLAVVNMCGDPVSTNLMEETRELAGCRTVLTRVYKITDDCGNEGMAVQTIHWINDETPPVLQAPADLELGCNPAFIPPAEASLASAVDDCGDVRFTVTNLSESTDGCEVTLTRVYTAEDSCGNSSSATQLITWTSGVEPPVLSGIPGGGDLSCGSDIPEADPALLVVEPSNCGGDIAVTIDYVLTNFLPRCTIQVIHGYRATDDCGNSVATEVEWTTILDGSTPPLLAVITPEPVDVTPTGARAPGDDCTTPIPVLEILAEGGCGSGPLVITQNPVPGTPVVAPSVTPITVTVSDDCGNTATQVVPFTVTGNCDANLEPSIALAKTVYVGWNDGAACDTAGEQVSGTNGLPITWCFTVTNTGEVRLNNVLLNDPLLNPALQRNLGSLAPGERMTVYEQRLLDGDVDNTANVLGSPSNGRPDVRATDPAVTREVNPSLDLQKTVAEGHNASCPGRDLIEVEPGANITWCFQLTNTGDVPLSNLRVVDPGLEIPPIPVPGILAPGESLNHGVNAVFTMTTPGLVTNIASAMADADGLPGVTDLSTATDPAVVAGPKAKIQITVFDDLNNNEMFDEAATFGVGGVTVTLTAPDGAQSTAVTSGDGAASFENLMSGEYTVTVNETTLPNLLSVADVYVSQVASPAPCECVELLVPLTGVTTDIELIGLTASGTVVTWTTASETDLLGFQLLDGDGHALHDRLILSGEGIYTLDTGTREGSYTLQAINSDLSTEEIEMLEVVDAVPVDGVAVVTATSGEIEVDAGTNILVPGATEARQNGKLLNGVTLVTDQGPALYVHVAGEGIVVAK